MYQFTGIFVFLIYTVYGQQTPYCTKFTGTASPNDPTLPDLPDQFQTTIEANFVIKGYTITAYEYFDNPGNRAAMRANKNDTDNISLFDYTNNQLTFINGKSCQVKNLTTDPTDVYFGSFSKGGIPPHILNSRGALHFLKSSGQQYMGKDVVRGISVDHWRSCIYWPQIRANFTLDYYFTVQEWKDAIAYPRIPVRAYVKGVTEDFTGAVSHVEHYYDYVDFRTEIADLTVFEARIAYIVDKVKGNCHVTGISETEMTSDFNQTAAGMDNLWFALTLKGPREILGLDGNFTYIGK
ncbi:uncharacterized protein LOC132757231, partial [Ruditapes philippinarum]|uniref:uncharacterized protein LOC132757231 n=1 Tax=Ruditapes philippinarum TaxID=129788 RepID=UPI00295BD8E2